MQNKPNVIWKWNDIWPDLQTSLIEYNDLITKKNELYQQQSTFIYHTLKRLGDTQNYVVIPFCNR